MSRHDIIVIGASAGGVKALAELARGLPPDLPAAVLVVLHIPADYPSRLPDILNLVGPLPAASVRDGEAIQPRRIYTAVPDHHLLVERGYLHVACGPKENGHRPAINPLFRTAARAYGPRVVGVILTGSLYDGTAGLVAVKSCGGVAIVQDPTDAWYPDMPRSAMGCVKVDHCLSLSDIAPHLVRLV